MATRFLSEAEIARLESFPETIDERDLARYFALDVDDLLFVRRQHSAAGQLGVALQLCSLRWLGFIPEDLPAAPLDATTALASLLDVPARAIFDYSVRPQTRREHRPLVRGHAGFAAAGERSLEPVRAWLIGSRHVCVTRISALNSSRLTGLTSPGCSARSTCRGRTAKRRTGRSETPASCTSPITNNAVIVSSPTVPCASADLYISRTDTSM